jgi:flavin-dependent dehydrogenase
VFMTARRRLDAHLAERAAAAGAELVQGSRRRSVCENGHVTAVSAAGRPRVGRRRCRRRQRHRREERRPGEGHHAWHRARGERCLGRPRRAPPPRTGVVRCGRRPGRLRLVFPKREHANVGVGGWGTVGPRLRDHLARLAASYGLPLTALSDVKGHRLPTRRPGGASRPAASSRR